MKEEMAREDESPLLLGLNVLCCLCVCVCVCVCVRVCLCVYTRVNCHSSAAALFPAVDNTARRLDTRSPRLLVSFPLLPPLPVSPLLLL